MADCSSSTSHQNPITGVDQDHSGEVERFDEAPKKQHSAHHAHFVDPQEHGDSRIHFLADDLNAHDSSILIEPLDRELLNVRLGFLQVRHVYEVLFSIVDDLGEDVLFDPLENIHAKIESAHSSEDGKGHNIVLTFSAMKEKIMQETVTLTSKNDSSKKLSLTLHARVLGKGKGTPSLKKGIHCLRIEWDEESDASDWQGF